MRRAAALTANLVAPAGLLLMALGTFGPWATAHPIGTADLVTVGGFDHGALVVLVLAAAGAVAWWLRLRGVLVAVTAVAAAWLLVVGYELPGSLNDSWAWGETDLAWGIEIALLGAVVTLCAALRGYPRSRIRQRSQEPRTSVVPSGE